MTLRSLDIGVGRAAAFVAFVRVTPLGPAFLMVERNPRTFVGFVTGSLDGSGARSSVLPFPFSSGSTLSGTVGSTGAGTTISSAVGGGVEGITSDESCFSGGCGSGIVGETGNSGSGSGCNAGPSEGLEVEGTSGYGSAGIGGSTETDLERETRWEGGVGDREGNRNDSGFGCGGIRCEDRLVRPALGSGFGSDGGCGRS